MPVHGRGARGRPGAPAHGRDRPRAAGGPARERPALGDHGGLEGGGPRLPRAIVTVEEIVDELELRPGGVVLPWWVIDAVSVAPYGAHPSYAHGYYERDNDFYIAWDEISRDRDTFLAWMQRHVLEYGGVPGASGRAGPA